MLTLASLPTSGQRPLTPEKARALLVLAPFFPIPLGPFLICIVHVISWTVYSLRKMMKLHVAAILRRVKCVKGALSLAPKVARFDGKKNACGLQLVIKERNRISYISWRSSKWRSCITSFHFRYC
jgi:hypothetical protein